MNSKAPRILISIGIILAVGLVTGLTLASAQGVIQNARNAAAVGTAFTYQGRLDQSGVPANGSFDFNFGVYDSPSGGAQVGITETQTLSVTNGIFSTSLDFGSGVFTGDPRYLNITVRPAGAGPYTALTPRQVLSAVPYAIYADNTDWGGIANMPAGFLDGVDDVGGGGVNPANILWVAKSGGDFTTVSAALASITDATFTNTYLIKIAPGVYTETGGIDLKSYVDIEGSGNRTTYLQAVGGNTDPKTAGSSATLRAGDVWAEVRSLHVDSYSTSNYAVAIWTTGAADSKLRFTDVVAEAAGGSVENIGIFNKSSAPYFDTFWVYVLNGTGTNTVGVDNYQVSNPTLNHGFVYVSHGASSIGIRNKSSAPELNRVTINAYLASTNTGMYNDDSTPVIATAMSFVTWGGVTNRGVFNTINSFSLIIDSYVFGSTNSLYSTAGSLGRSYNTTLDGPVSSLNECLDSHDAIGVALDTDCQTIGSGKAVTWGDVDGIPAGFADGVDNTGVSPDNIVWVATSGGDYTSIQTALNNITDATASNPYLVRIGPGIYTETVDLKPYVDIEGSGEGSTIIRSFGSGNPVETDKTSATLRATGPITAEVRLLTVEGLSAGNDHATGIWASSAGNALRFTKVSIYAAGGISGTVGLYNNNASPVMNHITAFCDGTGGFYNDCFHNDNFSSPEMNHIVAAASGAGENIAVLNLNNSSPRMNQVNATATGGQFTLAIANVEDSSPSMFDVTALASGASSQNYGVLNRERSNATMINVTANATGAAVYNFGVSNYDNAAPIMDNVTILASGATTNTAVSNNLTSTAIIRDSSLSGAEFGIRNWGATDSALVTTSQLDGPVTTGTTCLDSHDGAGQALDTSCGAIASGAVAWGDIAGVPAGVGVSPANIIWVATSGGDYTTVSAALAAVTTASASNPYLIRVAPGVYTETGGIDLKTYVDIEGSGEGVTILRALGGSMPIDDEESSATIRSTGIINAEIRFLTVESDGTGEDYAPAIWTSGADAGLRLTHISANAFGGINTWGIYNASSSPTMKDIRIVVTGVGNDTNTGVFNDFSSPSMSHVSASASGGSWSIGLHNSGGSFAGTMEDIFTSATGSSVQNIGIYNTNSAFAVIRDSNLTGAGHSIFNVGGSAAVFNSEMGGTISAGTTCLDSHNDSGQALTIGCAALPSGAIAWADIANVPAGLDDGDDGQGAMALSTNIGLSQTTGLAITLSGYGQLTALDQTALITMPFSIQIEGTSYNQIFISSHGWIEFTGVAGGANFTNSCLPSSLNSGPLVAAYWDDLTPTGNGVEYGYKGTAPNRVYVINYDAQTTSLFHNTDFQIQIHETSGLINIRYFDMAPSAIGQSATIGFQGAGGAAAKTYPISCNTAILDQNSKNEAWSIAPVR